MTRFRLLIRNLRHFRLANLAVIAGMAVATAVLTGALLVGDSVRASLRELAVQRLGPIDYALFSMQFFPEALADRLSETSEFEASFSEAVPGVLVRGGASNEAAAAKTAGVQIAALRESDWLSVPPGRAVINEELADVLSVTEPETFLLLSLPTADATPREATLARRSREEVISTPRVQVERIVREPGVLSLFNLAGGQRVPRNAWLNLNTLQNAVDQRRRANLLFVQAKGEQYGAAGAETLNGLLRQVHRLEDYGLELVKSEATPEVVLSARSTFIAPPLERAADEAAGAVGITPRKALVYLANHVTKLADGKPTKDVIHYAIVAGVDPLDGAALAADEVALNQWAADRLKAKVGDLLVLDYYERQPDGNLLKVRSDRPGVGLTFRVARILPMQGLAIDPTLTPEYEGLTDADSIADWDPPEGVAIDQRLVTDEDEAYWDKYQAAPKIFMNLATARRLWGNIYGDLNSIRVPAEKSEEFATELLKRIEPASMGLAFTAIKQEQLAAASGPTDFAGLFIGFSFFIIIAAAMLLAMLFRLGIEQRSRQFGLLGALGFAPRTLYRMSLVEGLILAVIGALVGIGAAVGYTWLMIYGLRTWWVGAVGTTALRLHVARVTLAVGFAASLLLAIVAIVWAVWRLRRAEAAALLGGTHRNEPTTVGGGRATRIIGLLGAYAGVGLVILGIVKPELAQATFLAGGAVLLAASLTWIAGRLRPGARAAVAPGGTWSIDSLGIRNAGRNRARSVTTIALIAFASFVLVTVASMKQQPPADTRDPETGTGGFQLILQSETPLFGDLNTRDGRNMLGLGELAEVTLENAKFVSMRSWAGQDISCLNITKPTSPTILAVPPSLIEQERFTFARTERDVENPWTLLTQPPPVADEIPVVTDDETARYILKLGIGESITINDQLNRPRKLRLVGTLSHSIFQGELLMSEANFRTLFPSQSGYGVVLIEAPDDALPHLRQLLGSELEDFAVTVERTSDRLARYQQVANTYLSTFQTLGALGLMLGTIGLAVILLRSLVERRSELALLAAIGFRSAARTRLVLAENGFLLLLGLAVGTLCALVGVAPAIISGRDINLPRVALTLAIILAFGMVVLAVATSLATRRVTPAALRAE